MSFGTQKNGLAVECILDTIGVHDFADSSSWAGGTSDSSWVLYPVSATSPYHNKVVRITAMQLDLAEDIVMASGQEMLVKFFMEGNANPVATYTYASMSDWISRAMRKEPKSNSANVGNYVQYDIQFAQKPTFWTSTGYDASGAPKLNKMLLTIANNTPYNKASAAEPATIARPRYFAEIYNDPDI